MKPFHTTEMLWFTAGDKNDHVIRTTLKKKQMKREINFKSVEWLFWVLHGKLGKIELEDWVKKEEEIKGQQGSCKSCLPCFIAVVLDFDQRLLGNKDKTNNKKRWGKSDILISGGRNLQGRNGKRPKPLGVKSEKGRNLWQPW